MADATFRECMISMADKIRQKVLVDSTQKRVHRVYVRTRTWSGTRIGAGTATDSDLELVPRPKVRVPEPRATTAPPGQFEVGDLVVSKISATYSRQQLGDRDKPIPLNVEVFWVKVDAGDDQDGTPDTREEHYHLISLELRFTTWTAILVRKRDRPL